MNQLQLTRLYISRRTTFFATFTKNYSQSSTPKKPSITPEKYKDTFNCVYKFKYINQLRLFSRMKIYQTVGSTLMGVASVVAYDAKIFTELNSLLMINGAMAFALVMLLIISRQTVKVVGRIYVSDNGQKVMLSHLNFMGKRRDIEIDSELVEPLSSLDELNDDVLKLRLKDMDGFMYVPLKHCDIYDKERFLKVFNIVLKKKKLE